MAGLARTWAIVVTLTLLCGLAAAAPTEPASPAASEPPSVAAKVGNSVKHGLETAASATERGVKKAAHAVGRAASATGRAVERTARKVGLPAASSSAASSAQ